MPVPWFSAPRPLAAPRLRLVCFPYAGGNAATYRSWAGLLPPGVELVAALLPGRAERLDEPPLVDLDVLLSELVAAAGPLLGPVPLILFGHSLGATVAYEFGRALATEHGCVPAALLVSGAPAPPVRRRRTGRGLSDDDLERILGKRTDLPAGWLTAELKPFVFPALRADLQLLDGYRWRPGPLPGVPVVAFGGDADPDVSAADLRAWQRCTTGPARTHVLAGDHFFIAHQPFRELLAATVGEFAASPIAR
ncbi:thioesterase II family protein [Actinoplanes teichomyceticus]|uniref:Pyochelin biosynthetic protein PchC n=1 Tax=Actinoplanes teichomyceticus TaxID=1867 RepID=Q6ZZG3_ACTTI|nr:alpha/beta fold hydrolase [Actinoplanes teichomyceticus]TWG09448.1 pyochelin biosynthetic protein PchC [Actinoplanes teichomyceticus]GIF17137.1 oleoyl-ACP hydrolase [Actinoplanes teichomyceticus]CAE53380.1 thioesterase [Actinoplanes teichomyceticus]CAG15042.1 thioesterase, type II [Actinoplanes teichomyceticus]